MRQQFVLNDGSRPTLEVVKQRSHREGDIDIQISQVLDFNNYTLCKVDENIATVTVACRYIYEEINPSQDSVIYARYIGLNQIKRWHPWWDD